ncbi:MAG: pantetheine-phosphate adenylyltransferase [Paludibacteraceae bacterium]|nr:pantetheine-phosphate adenylyltransferase [Paludibacteraceae bacterium]
MRVAIFPGSFDPFTIGHADIVRRALPLFDTIVIGVGVNAQKHALFPTEERVAAIQKVFRSEPKVKVRTYSTLTVDFAKEENATFMLRGVRSTTDFEYEKAFAEANRQLSGIETVLMLTRPEYEHISSSLVRDLYSYGKDITPYLPK